MKPLVYSSILAGAVFIAAAAAQTTAPAGAKYQPRLTPRFTVGQAFGYRATATFAKTLRVVQDIKTPVPHTKTFTRSQDVVQDFRLNFSAELTTDGALARAVFPNGSLREMELLINRCVFLYEDGKSEIAIPRGSILGVRKQDDGQTAFAINGKAPPPELAERLSLLVQMGEPRYTNDELLGPPAPVPVGTTWPVNEKAVLASSLAQIFPGTQQARGSLSLLSVRPDAAGRLVTTVGGSYALGGSLPPFPPEVQPKASQVNFEVQVTAPVAAGPGEHNIELKCLIRHQGRTGNIDVGMSETRVEINLSLELDAHFTLGAAPVPLAKLQTAPPVPLLAPLAGSLGMSSAQIYRPPPMPTEISAAPKPDAPAAPKPGKPATTPPPPASPPPLILPTLEPDSPFNGAQPLPPQKR